MKVNDLDLDAKNYCERIPEGESCLYFRKDADNKTVTFAYAGTLVDLVAAVVTAIENDEGDLYDVLAASLDTIEESNINLN